MQVQDTTPTLQDKVESLAALINADTLAHYKAQQSKYYPDSSYDYTHDCTVRATYAKKYVRVDRGSSGKYMIDIATEVIYGIKSYGVIHRGHQYGTLDSTHEWYWGGYVAEKKADRKVIRLATHNNQISGYVAEVAR